MASQQLSLQSKIIMKQKKTQTMTDLHGIIDDITRFCSKAYFNKALKKLAAEHIDNATTICNYIISEQNQINIKQSTKEGKIKVLIWLSNFHSGKSFTLMTKQNILSYLDSLKRPLTEDISQKWIASYNGRHMILNKFFRWLFNPDEPDQQKRITPPCMQGVKKLPQKIRTRYRPVDLWDSREHAIFLKYCPDKRDQCYHAIAIDSSARPHEILNLKISDVQFRITEDGRQYAEMIIKEGKTGTRTVPLIDSIPYVKTWIENHPSGSNPNSWLFISKSNNSQYQKLTYDGIVDRYSYYYKIRYFPKLLEDKAVPDTDKSFIKNMLTKPWNLYIFRHSSLTDKSQILTESLLKEHAGWSMSSSMPQVYIHLRGQSSKILLQNRGIIKKEDSKNAFALRSKSCPNCNEPNKPDSKFCCKCRMILAYDSYNDVLKAQKEKEDTFMKMEQKFESMQQQFQKMISSFDSLNQEAKNQLAHKLVTDRIYRPAAPMSK
jgi:integrase